MAVKEGDTVEARPPLILGLSEEVGQYSSLVETDGCPLMRHYKGEQVDLLTQADN